MTSELTRYALIIPACDEAACIRAVLRELELMIAGYAMDIVVGVNGSRDETARIARECGALVAETPQRGYGYGCQAAVELAERALPGVAAFIFFAGDGANDPADLPALLQEFEAGSPMVLGCRTRLHANRTSMEPQFVLANRVFGFLCGCLTGRLFADLGPLRVIDRRLFHQLRLHEWTFGWTIEAQVRAAMLGVNIVEIPARERRRIAGEQKVSRVSWRRTLAIGLRIVIAGFRARFGKYSLAPDRSPAPGTSRVAVELSKKPILTVKVHANAPS